MLKGIDISSYQGNIDWATVKSQIDFAILRCGYGSDFANQDDKKWAANLAAVEQHGIPYGVYLYSYAKTAAKIDSEVAHVLRLAGKHKPFCIYIDMEDASTTSLGKSTLTSFGLRFCKAITAAGFKAGVYANQYWCNTYLDIAQFAKAGYSIWCAKYSSVEPKISAKYDIWQYSSRGKVKGIKGNVDMNYMYNDIRSAKQPTQAATQPTPATPVQQPTPAPAPTPAPVKIKVTYQVHDSAKKKWLNNIVGADGEGIMAYAGNLGNAIDALLIDLSEGDVYYRVHVKGDRRRAGRWLPEVKNRKDYAGNLGQAIDGIMIRTTKGKIHYQAHTVGGKWLGVISGYNAADSTHGYAGIFGRSIDAIKIYID